MKKRKILVTSALPYANGSIHLGHIMEVVQTDIWVRFQKAMGHECYYFCADDTHGTPVMLAAKNMGISPIKLIEKIQKEHKEDFRDFSINFDNYYSTHSKENQNLSEEIYLKLKSKGHITKREISQSYCEKDKIFLPDRYIKGNCPKCKAEEQYGDSCESCGKSYSPNELINSSCILCGEKPILKKTEHIFFELNHFENFLKNWIETKNPIAEGAVKKLQEWFSAGLQAWDISRDAPYFGFEIPEEKDKFFYVWLDAPIGYIASSLNFFEEKKNLQKFNTFWKNLDSGTEIIHFIGKDISYFHTLFWPAMLKGVGYNIPKKIHIHGFIKVNGEKMSKSKGTFIQARDYLNFLDAEHFRFYLASKLNSGMDDLDFSFDEYRSKVNSDLVGNLVNLISRVSTSILNQLDRKIGYLNEQDKLELEKIREQQEVIQKNYETCNYNQVIRTVTKIGDNINKKINDTAPWKLIKTEPEKVRDLITFSLNASRYLSIYLYPIIPNLSKKIYKFLQISQEPSFSHLEDLIENKEIGNYEPITERVNEKTISKLQNFLSNKETEKLETEKITINEFSKADIRIGKILEVQEVAESQKLLQLKVDFGKMGLKNVFAGIKNSYKPEELQGLKAIFVVNLQPRKMKFGVSEAMLLAVGDKHSILIPHKKEQVNLGDRLS